MAYEEQAGFALRTEQVEKLQSLISTFYERAVNREIFDGPFLLLLQGVRAAIVDGDAIEQYQIDVLVWLLECYIEQFEESDIDPHAEDCYHKLVGYWFEDIEPWYKRIKELDKELQ